MFEKKKPSIADKSRIGKFQTGFKLITCRGGYIFGLQLVLEDFLNSQKLCKVSLT